MLSILDTSINSNPVADSNGGTNPADKFGEALGEWQGPLSTFGLVVGAIIAVVCLITMMVVPAQRRAQLKTKLIVVICCVVGLLGVTMVITYAKAQGQHVFGQQTVAPRLKLQLSSLFPNL